ncbi:flagellar basal body-associated FliL family protein [Desulfoplanes sp.]
MDGAIATSEEGDDVADTKNTESEAPKKGKRGIVKWLILIILLACIGAGGFFAYQHFFAQKNVPGESAVQGEGGSADGTSGDESSGEGEERSQMFSIPAFVVNLADPLGRRYLKLSLDVEVKNLAVLEKTEEAMPRIKDSLLLLLSSKTYEDLSSMEDKIALKNEIMSRLGQILGTGKVSNVYFTEFIVQ